MFFRPFQIGKDNFAIGFHLIIGCMKHMIENKLS
jgi:hypothetical protein